MEPAPRASTRFCPIHRVRVPQIVTVIYGWLIWRQNRPAVVVVGGGGAGGRRRRESSSAISFKTGFVKKTPERVPGPMPLPMCRERREGEWRGSIYVQCPPPPLPRSRRAAVPR